MFTSVRYNECMKDQLAKWVAAGGEITIWCREHGVPSSTAYTWKQADWFKRRVEMHHRGVARAERAEVNRAIATMTRNLSKSVVTIERLIEHGETDGVKLRAARTLIDNLLDVSRDSELKDEIRQLRDRIDSIR